MSTTTNKKILEGVVVSTKMQKTAVVEVSRYVKHPKYGKYLNRSKHYKAHDPEGKAVVGARVRIEECNNIYKDKHFRLI